MLTAYPTRRSPPMSSQPVLLSPGQTGWPVKNCSTETQIQGPLAKQEEPAEATDVEFAMLKAYVTPTLSPAVLPSQCYSPPARIRVFIPRLSYPGLHRNE